MKWNRIIYILFLISVITCRSVVKGACLKKDVEQLSNNKEDSTSLSLVMGKLSLAPVALKTNLLYDCILIPNLEMEIYINSCWSFNMEARYAWWSKKSVHLYYRTIHGSPEIRYHFKQKEYFYDQFIGFYVSGGIYEFMFSPRAGYQGDVFTNMGVTYGYRKRISRQIGFEFSAGIGYKYVRERDFHWNGTCYVYDEARYTHSIGLTQTKLSLLFMLNRNNKK